MCEDKPVKGFDTVQVKACSHGPGAGPWGEEAVEVESVKTEKASTRALDRSDRDPRGSKT